MLPVLVLAGIFVVALDLVGPASYPAELLAFFRPWATGVLAALACAAALRPRDGLWIPALVAAAVHGAGTLAPLDRRPSSPPLEETAELRIVTINALHGAVRPAAVAAFVAEARADVLLLQEARLPYARRIAEATGFALQQEPRASVAALVSPAVLAAEGACGVAEPIERGPGFIRVAACLAPAGGAPVLASLYSVHADTPRSIPQFERRNATFDALAERLAREPPGRPVAIGGDFNAPPWSHALSRLLASADLSLVGGLGNLVGTRFFLEHGGPTWLAAPIDLVATRGAAPGERIVGPPLGSDHLPVVATIGLPRGGEPAQAAAPGPTAR